VERACIILGVNHRGEHKRKKSGGKTHLMRKKRANRAGNQPSLTKIGTTEVRKVRCRGGNIKMRALKAETGFFRFLSSGKIYPAKLIEVMYHPSSKDFVRRNILTKSSVVKVDATPFMSDVKSVGEEKDPALWEAANKGHVYGIVTCRPGQVGDVQGYILQDKELGFYMQRFKKKRKQ
jgi:small subunit ribosomal protein S8e